MLLRVDFIPLDVCISVSLYYTDIKYNILWMASFSLPACLLLYQLINVRHKTTRFWSIPLASILKFTQVCLPNPV